MPKMEIINELLTELRELDRKLRDGELSIDNYLFLKGLAQNNLVHCYSDIIDNLKN